MQCARSNELHACDILETILLSSFTLHATRLGPKVFAVDFATAILDGALWHLGREED